MGGGIAAVNTLQAGVRTRLKEVDAAAVGRGLAHVHRMVDDQVARRRLHERDAAKAAQLITGTVDWSGFHDADVVIEAVFEDLELKRAVLAEVEAVTGDDTIFASNTSSIPIALIAETASRPHNVIGMHYFSPVEKMPLLEVVVAPTTADEVTVTCVELGRRQGKTVIVVNDGPGFYTSRILGPLHERGRPPARRGGPDRGHRPGDDPLGIPGRSGDPGRRGGHRRRRQDRRDHGGGVRVADGAQPGLRPAGGRRPQGAQERPRVLPLRGRGQARGRPVGVRPARGHPGRRPAHRPGPGTALPAPAQRVGALPGGGHPPQCPRRGHRCRLRAGIPAVPRRPVHHHRPVLAPPRSWPGWTPWPRQHGDRYAPADLLRTAAKDGKPLRG